MKISIGDKEYNVKEAHSEEERRKGLQDVKELPKDEGMLFIFDSPGKHTMWMKDTLIPLDQIFIDDDQEVIKVISREPNDETLIGVNNTKYVLEVNANSGIKVGDDMEIIDDETDDAPVMRVLAPDGSTQMELWGGERIFSRKNTVVLIRQAKKAYNSKSDSDYKRLGKSIFRYLNGQAQRDPEYVQLPD